MSFMKLLCVVLLASQLVLAHDDYDFLKESNKIVSVDALLAYGKWKFNNRRNYLSEEEQNFRQFIFFDNFKKIQDHNSNADVTYKVGLNQFSDMTEEEFESRLLNKSVLDTYNTIHAESKQNEVSDESDKRKLDNIPSSVDWRNRGAVTGVRNQGSCSSCWAFSTVGLLEGANFIRNRKLTSFSEQQLVDCCSTANGFLCQGCNGGWPSWALDYVKKYGALEQSSYPYIGSKSSCKVQEPTNGFYVKGYEKVDESAEALKAAVSRGPVSVVIHASYWFDYISGTFNKCSWDKIQANHAVLLVGYTQQGEWIVKNSWGTNWGEDGYIKLSPGNTCGIYNYAIAIN